MVLKKIKKQNIYEIAMLQIKQYIKDSELKPGDKLMSEQEISKSLGISRNTVREALKTMQGLGIIEIKPGDGMFLRPFNFDAILDNLSYSLVIDKPEIQELLDARKALEFYFIKDAIQKSKPETISKLNEIIKEMYERVSRGIKITDLDEKFHMTLYEGVENKVLLKLIYVFWKVMNLISDQSIGKETDLQGDYLSHKKIVEHIVDRNVEKARDAIKEHFLSIEKRLKNRKGGEY